MEAMAHGDFGLDPGSEDYENFKSEVFKTATSINELQIEAETSKSSTHTQKNTGAIFMT
jgi:hypothetical protein